jgi:putative transposase
VDSEHDQISIRRQCELLGLARSSLYYEPAGDSEENLQLMRLIDEEYTRHPFYGSRRLTEWLGTQGWVVNRKRVARLMQRMGLVAVYPKPHLSQPDEEHTIYPYLLRDVAITRVNQVWSTDITYIRLSQGFVYLVAVMDWFSRFVLSWRVSVSLEGSFCREALQAALRRGRPEIFNTDQGSQFTATAFTQVLQKRGIRISMDGRGRCLDKAYASYCTSCEPQRIFSLKRRRFSSLTPCAFCGGLGPGSSYSQSSRSFTG